MRWLSLNKCCKIFCLLAMVFGLSITPAVAMANADVSYNVRVLVGEVSVPSEAPPYIIVGKGVTMVPARFIAETLGATVSWDPRTSTATIAFSGKTIALTIGRSSALVNGQSVMLSAPAEIRNSRTMVPLRFVMEQLNAKVYWDPNTYTVRIFTPSEQEKEMRGAWIATVYNIDWPSKPGLGIAEQKAEFVRMLDELKAVGINAVFVQVRPTADALYPSKLVPWSSVLTGTQGKNPGYDPLAFMVAETHKRGMAFHAWFNPFRVTLDDKLDSLAANNPAKLHPEWIIQHGGKWMFNPGIPAARAHIIDAIMEVVRQYDIDGVHLDDYFYPYGSDPFNDDATFAQYNAGRFTDKGDWRRDNVNQFVHQLSASIKQAKPYVAFGISPFGIWRNAKDDPTGSDTNGQSSYDNLYADARTWIRNGWIDYIAPQLYWTIGYKNASYDKLVDWWSKETSGTGVKLYIGQAAYMVGANTTNWAGSDAIIDELKYNRTKPQVKGSIFFSAKDVIGNKAGITDALKQFYSK